MKKILLCYRKSILLFLILAWIFPFSGFAEGKKVLICGICKNVEKQLPVAFESIEALARGVSDYRVVIYENNSTDRTKELLKSWAATNPKVVIIHEDLTRRALKDATHGKQKSRTEYIARARNRLLDEIMQNQYDPFELIVMADLDMDPWDVPEILATLERNDLEWDAVLANGSYDRFAFRNEEYPFGRELIGEALWKKMLAVDLHLSETGEWKRVYSAFGGLGIYQREAIRGCRYSGVVTAELETLMQRWIQEGLKRSVFLAKEYENLVQTVPIIEVRGKYLKQRDAYPECIGVRLHRHGGKVTWFGIDPNKTLPTVCEHIPFHAAMIARGRDKIFINPKLKSTHP